MTDVRKIIPVYSDEEYIKKYPFFFFGYFFNLFK